MRYSTTTILIFLAILLSAPVFGQKKSKKKKGEGVQVVTEQQKYEQADLFVKAISARELGKLEESLDLFEQAIALDPNEPAAYYERARVLQRMKRNDEALISIKKAVEFDEKNKWYKVLFADLSKANGNYADYVVVYEELLAEYPNDLNFLNELAFAYFFIGDYQKSVDVYQLIEEKVGINEALSSQKVNLYDRIGEKDKAVAEYERLISFYPDEARYYALLAEYCAKNNMNDKAIAAYEMIVEINPQDPYVHLSLADFYKKEGEDEKSFEELKIGLSNPKLDLKTKINLLFAYYSGNLNEEQKKQALELSEILKQTHPDDPMSESFYASMLFENQEYEAARELFQNMVKQDPSNYGIWEQLLFCNLYLEDYASLAVKSEDAIDYFPSYPLPYFFAGIANFQLKDFVKAQAYLDSGKDFVVGNNALLEQFYSTLGDTYNELEKYEASYASYDKALQLNPENAIVLNNYAYYLSLRNEHLERAATMAKKSVDMDPYNNNNLDTYAWVLYKLEKYEEALNWIKKAYNNGGESSGVVLEHYGDILFKLDQKDEALKFWKMAKEKAEYSDFLDKKIKDNMLYE